MPLGGRKKERDVLGKAECSGFCRLLQSGGLESPREATSGYATTRRTLAVRDAFLADWSALVASASEAKIPVKTTQ